MDFLARHTAAKFFYEGLWRDEAFSWAMANQGIGAVPLTAQDFNPPLYYLLLSAWMQILGSSEAAMRSLSILFFCATLIVAWRFMIDMLAVPRRRAGLYLVLFAINPMLSYYAVEARMYSLLAFLAASSLYAHLAGRPLLYVISTTLGLYTHYFMLLVIGCQLAGVVLTDRRLPRLRRRLWVLAAPPALFVPWLVVTLWVKEDFGSEFWVEATGWKFGLHLVTSMYTGHDAIYGFLERPERRFFALCLIPLLLWSLWSGYRWIEGRRVALHSAALALLPPVAIFVLSFVKPLFVPRYLIFSSVALLLLFVAGLERARPGLRTAMFLILCGLALQYQVLQAHRHTKGMFRETIGEVAGQAGPDDLLYVRSELDFFPAQYYFGEPRVFIFGPKYEEVKPFSGKVLIPASRVVDGVPRAAKRVFLLDSDTAVAEISLQDRAAAGRANVTPRIPEAGHASWK